jgi:hypothetical protein
MNCSMMGRVTPSRWRISQGPYSAPCKMLPQSHQRRSRAANYSRVFGLLQQALVIQFSVLGRCNAQHPFGNHVVVHQVWQVHVEAIGSVLVGQQTRIWDLPYLASAFIELSTLDSQPQTSSLSRHLSFGEKCRRGLTDEDDGIGLVLFLAGDVLKGHKCVLPHGRAAAYKYCGQQ